MNKKAKISVVIPAYNAENTLERCIKSLQNQTLKEISIIIVDDGSIDKTSNIADKLAESDNRIIVIHKKNAGCYMARATGVEQVDTPYFGFVDADDWVEPDMFEKMICSAEENNLDILECEVFEGRVKNEPQLDLYLSRENVLKKYVYPRMMLGLGSNTVWNKIYKRELYNKTFLKGFFSTWEDLIWNMQLFCSANKIGVLHKGFYHYEITGNSSVRNFSKKNIEGMRNTIVARERLAEMMGFNKNDRALSVWIVHNIKNMILSASIAPAPSFQMRKDHLKSLLFSPDIKSALGVLGRFFNKETVFIAIARLLPITLLVLGVKVMRKFI